MSQLNSRECKRFRDIAWERHRIYCLKELGCKKPWSDDRIFQRNYFCNVFRHIDKTTVWIVKNIIHFNEMNDMLWAWIMLARFLSRISTLERIRKNCHGSLMCAQSILREMQKERVPIVTNAFIVNSGSATGFTDKITYIFRTLKYFKDNLEPDMLLQEYKSLEEAYYLMRSASGVGPFMAYQYVVDFTYSGRYLRSATDHDTWTELGLGANRGLNRLLQTHNKLNKKAPDGLKHAQYMLDQWRHNVVNQMAAEIDQTYAAYIEERGATKGVLTAIRQMYKPFNKLHLCDVEHWLCEYDKYMRGGSGKRNYDGGYKCS